VSLFRGTAPYYAQFRPGYPDELIRLLAEHAELGSQSRVLDLGCGTGQLAVPLAAYAGRVIAVDPEPEMLDAIEGPANLETVCARAEEVDSSWGSFRLTTIGNAFHWMEVSILDRLPTDCVALCSCDDQELHRSALELAEELLGPRPPHAQPFVPWEEVLGASPFSRVERFEVEQELTYSVDDLVGHAFSTSYASPERLGDLRDAFEQALRSRLKPGTFRVTGVACLGRRGDQ
jgi:SAM-dependent methyltransferase